MDLFATGRRVKLMELYLQDLRSIETVSTQGACTRQFVAGQLPS